MSTRPPVVLPRLTLRPMTSDDLPAYADMHGRAEVARYLYWEPRGPEEARASLERKAANADPSEFVLAAVRNSDAAFVGEVNLHIYDAGNRAAEIGFIFNEQNQTSGDRRIAPSAHYNLIRAFSLLKSKTR